VQFANRFFSAWRLKAQRAGGGPATAGSPSFGVRFRGGRRLADPLGRGDRQATCRTSTERRSWSRTGGRRRRLRPGTGYGPRRRPDGATWRSGNVRLDSQSTLRRSTAGLPSTSNRDCRRYTTFVSFPNLLVAIQATGSDIPRRLIAYLEGERKAKGGDSTTGSSARHVLASIGRDARGADRGRKMGRARPVPLHRRVGHRMRGGHIQACDRQHWTDDLAARRKPEQVGAIGVSTPRRSPSAPDVPAIGETVGQARGGFAWARALVRSGRQPPESGGRPVAGAVRAKSGPLARGPVGWP